jgi:hypothetical protein
MPIKVRRPAFEEPMTRPARRPAATCYTVTERRVMSITRGAGRMPEHRDKPASAMAHGPAKRSDIERVRRDIDDADARSVHAEEVAVARHRQRVASRVAEHEEDAQA